MKNVWLVRNGRPLESTPSQAPIAQAATAKVKPLVEAWTRADNPKEKTAAAEKLDALGLSAVAALKELSADEKTDGPTRAYLQNARLRFAAIVRETRIPSPSPSLPPGLRKIVDETKGKQLTAERYAEILKQAVAAWPADSANVSIDLERESDEPGLVLQIEYRRGTQKRSEGSAALAFSESFSVDGAHTHGVSGSHFGSGRSKDGWTDMNFEIVTSLRRVLESDADAPFAASVQCDDRKAKEDEPTSKNR